MKDPFVNLNLTRGSDRRWGVIGISFVVIGLLIAGLLYVVPFGKDTYTALLRYSGQVGSGDQVRIAGVAVGSVGDVSLEGDVVEVTFTVDSKHRLGDLTAAEVKLLTPVGGHYLAITPSGDGDLGTTPIPPERTKTPFELTNVLESMVPLTTVSGDSLRETIREVNRAIAGRPDSIRSLMADGTELLTTLAMQSDQLDRAVHVGDEYVAAIAEDKQLLASLVRHLGGVAVKLADRRTDIIATFQSLRRMAKVVHRPIMAYGDHIEPVVSDVEEILRTLMSDVTKIDNAIAGLEDVIGSLGKMVGEDGEIEIDQSKTVVSGTGVCVPLPGKEC